MGAIVVVALIHPILHGTMLDGGWLDVFLEQIDSIMHGTMLGWFHEHKEQASP
jgi:hypothetical protein